MTFKQNRSKRDLVFTGLGLVGMATIVLPFASNISPLRIVIEALTSSGWWSSWWIVALALPFFLTIPASIVSLRALILGRFTKAEAACAWFAAVSAACALLSVVGMALSDASQIDEWREVLLIAAPPAALTLGAVTLAWVGRRIGMPFPPLTVMAMQWVYIADAAFCLVLIPWDGWRAGAYLTLATALIYLTHIATMLWRAPGRRAKIATGQVSSTTGTTGGTA